MTPDEPPDGPGYILDPRPQPRLVDVWREADACALKDGGEAVYLPHHQAIQAGTVDVLGKPRPVLRHFVNWSDRRGGKILIVGPPPLTGDPPP